ncbi:hypothetical protein [Nostoc sp.]
MQKSENPLSPCDLNHKSFTEHDIIGDVYDGLRLRALTNSAATE